MKGPLLRTFITQNLHLYKAFDLLLTPKLTALIPKYCLPVHGIKCSLLPCGLNKGMLGILAWLSNLLIPFFFSIVLFLSPHSLQKTMSLSSQHPRVPSTPPWDLGSGSYKAKWDSFYIRLLLVLAALYDSTGSSDVGLGAKGRAGRLLRSHSASHNLIALFAFTAIKVCLGVNPRVGPGPNETPSTRHQMGRVSQRTPSGKWKNSLPACFSKLTRMLFD